MALRIISRSTSFITGEITLRPLLSLATEEGATSASVVKIEPNTRIANRPLPGVANRPASGITDRHVRLIPKIW
jgi:hypothetical protein